MGIELNFDQTQVFYRNQHNALLVVCVGSFLIIIDIRNKFVSISATPSFTSQSNLLFILKLHLTTALSCIMKLQRKLTFLLSKNLILVPIYY